MVNFRRCVQLLAGDTMIHSARFMLKSSLQRRVHHKEVATS